MRFDEFEENENVERAENRKKTARTASCGNLAQQTNPFGVCKAEDCVDGMNVSGFKNVIKGSSGCR